MAGSSSSDVVKKRELYDLLKPADKNVIVTLELNPYINIISEDPLELELQYCNVFFRHNNGDYHDQLG